MSAMLAPWRYCCYYYYCIVLMQLPVPWPSAVAAYQLPRVVSQRSKVSPDQVSSTYFYLAIGSNMLSDTMTSLRNLQPLSVTAAVLPGYELAFDIRGGPLEPSAASVRRATGSEDNQHDAMGSHDGDDGDNCCSLIHGVLYELTESDFVALGRSEGVPWAYRWERVRVIPYCGNGASAGRDAYRAWWCERRQRLQKEQVLPTDTKIDSISMPALVLTASPLAEFLFGSSSSTDTTSSSSKAQFIPPSPSYLQILRDGAAQWRLDQSYQDQLAAISTDARFGPGLSGWLLQAARWSNPKPHPAPSQPPL
jgi:hypothetical protein